MSTCSICATPLDPVWAEIGQDRHSWCVEEDCKHGEPRGSRYCALCRYANPLITPPTPPVVKRRKRRKLIPA